jgi:PAS domain S-box-containing protein
MSHISERQLAEAARRDQATEPDHRGAVLEVVASAAQRFLNAPSTEEEVSAMLGELGQSAGVDRVAVYENRTAQDGGLMLSCRYEWVRSGVGSPRHDDDEDIPYLPTLRRWQRLLSAGEVLQAHLGSLPTDEAIFLDRQQIQAVAVVPVFAGDHWWGAMAFGQCARRTAWPKAEVSALRAAAGIFGAIAQQHRAEAALRETEDRYQRLVESSPDAIVVHRKGVITFANPAAAKLLGGGEPSVLVGRSVLEFVHIDSRPGVLQRLQRLREGKSIPPVEEKFVRLDGTPIEVEVAAIPFMVDGEPAVQIVVRDVTARRAAEEAMRQSEARKSSMLQSAQDAVITIDHEGRLLEFNPAAEAMFGRSRAEVLDQPMADLLVPPSLRSQHVAGLARYLATGESTLIGRRIETVAMRADGSEFPIELAVIRVDVPGPAMFTAYVRDITDRKRSELALRESEDRYRRLVERSPDAIAVHCDGKFVFANEAAARLLGAQGAQQIIGLPLLDVVHPDYWALVKERARQQTEDGVDVPPIEEKIVRLDGGIIDVEVSGMPLTFEGRPAGQIVIRDVTLRKRAESALRQRGEYLAALHETALGLMSRLEVRDLLEDIVSRAAALLDTPNGAIYLVHAEEKELELHVGTGVFAGWIGDRVKRGEGVLGRIWDSGKLSTIADYARWPGRSPDGRDDILRAGIAAPLTSASQFLGIIGVAHTDPGKAFDEDDEALLEQFARLASIALDNAQLYADAQKQLLERQRVDLRLREAETKYRTLVERIPAITYTAEFGETAAWLYVSPQIEAILGFTPHEWMVRPNLWSRRLHPEDRDRVLADEQQSQDTGVPMLCEYRLLTKQGRVVWVRDESVVAKSADGQPLLQGVMLDITERKRAEGQLREAEARYRTLVEQIPAITYIDSYEGVPGQYRTTYVSPQIESMLGYSSKDFMDKPDLWPTLIHPADRDRVLARDSYHYATGERLNQEYRLVARDGHEVWVLDEAVVVQNEKGDPQFSQGILYDITDRKRAEEDLERALQIERQATERLRALDELKNTFLHAVSHELRTPLAAVLGFALTLERKEVKLQEADRMDIIHRLAVNARKLDQLLSDLLDLDRLDRGILEPRRRPTDVASLVRRVVEGSEIVGARPVRVEAELVVAQLDGPKVERIVENLLVNAVRHTPPDCTIWVKVSPEEDGVLITVEDQGAGVPEDLRETIFEPFRQGPLAPAHSPGVGIGLSLVARFAELHGGRAWVEDRPGGGASFKVFLPGAPYFSTGAPTSDPYSVQEPS